MKNQINEKIENTRTNKGIKRFISSVLVIAVVAVAAFAGYAYYNKPVNYMSLNINPGVEIALNAMNRVVGVEAANEDGQQIMEGENIRNMSVEKAISVLVQHAYEQGYVAQDGSTVIAVNAESNNDEKAANLVEKSSNGINFAMEAKNAYSAIHATTSDLSFRNEAKEMGVSPGKYRLIKVLQSLDSEITVDEYKNAKVSAIIQKTNDLAKESGNFENLSEETKAMVNKAQGAADQASQNQVKAAQKNQDKEKNQNQNSDEEASQNQEQEKEKNKNGDSQVSENISNETSMNQSQQASNSNQGSSEQGQQSGQQNRQMQSNETSNAASNVTSGKNSDTGSGQGSDSGNGNGNG